MKKKHQNSLGLTYSVVKGMVFGKRSENKQTLNFRVFLLKRESKEATRRRISIRYIAGT